MTTIRPSASGRVWSLACIALMLTACSPTAPFLEDDMALTHDQVVDRVERLISDAANVVAPQPVLQLIGDSGAPCLDAGAVGSQYNGQIAPGRSYFVTGLPPDRTPEQAVDLLAQFWQQQGYRLEYDGRPQVPTHGYDAGDGFGINVDVNADGDLSMAAGGPCVDPD